MSVTIVNMNGDELTKLDIAHQDGPRGVVGKVVYLLKDELWKKGFTPPPNGWAAGMAVFNYVRLIFGDVELRYPWKNLEYYGVRDGDTLVMVIVETEPCYPIAPSATP